MLDENQSGSSNAKKAWMLIETVARAIAAAVALIAAAGFLVPSIGTLVNLVTSRRFGATGYVYHEIGENRHLTDDGRWYLPRAGAGTYADLSVGDKLQAVDEVRLREKASGDPTAEIFELRKGDCVIVLSKDHEVRVQKALSGGWLKVATTACGLFR